jgi:hypothetical protein
LTDKPNLAGGVPMFVAGRVPERYDQADKILMRLRKKWLEEGAA